MSQELGRFPRLMRATNSLRDASAQRITSLQRVLMDSNTVMSPIIDCGDRVCHDRDAKGSQVRVEACDREARIPPVGAEDGPHLSRKLEDVAVILDGLQKGLHFGSDAAINGW